MSYNRHQPNILNQREAVRTKLSVQAGDCSKSVNGLTVNRSTGWIAPWLNGTTGRSAP